MKDNRVVTGGDSVKQLNANDAAVNRSDGNPRRIGSDEEPGRKPPIFFNHKPERD